VSPLSAAPLLISVIRDELVVRRKWLDDTTYADLVALCLFLPGPASSQLGFSLGLLRGNGFLGGLAAWFAFTMPSALILFAFAMGAGSPRLTAGSPTSSSTPINGRSQGCVGMSQRGQYATLVRERKSRACRFGAIARHAAIACRRLLRLESTMTTCGDGGRLGFRTRRGKQQTIDKQERPPRSRRQKGGEGS
jgi:Chromate transporter